MTRLVTFAMPTSDAYLRRLGRIALVHARHEHILKLTLKVVRNSTAKIQLSKLERTGPGQLRDLIQKEAASQVDQATVAKLSDLMKRCGQASKGRNEAMHTICAVEGDGEPMLYGSGGSRKLPGWPELRRIERNIVAMTKELDLARRQGFLAVALGRYI
jgi:hypothetical protein